MANTTRLTGVKVILGSIVLVIIPLLVHLLVLSYEVAIYLSLPILVTHFIRAGTEDYREPKSASKVLRNFVLIASLTTAFI